MTPPARPTALTPEEREWVLQAPAQVREIVARLEGALAARRPPLTDADVQAVRNTLDDWALWLDRGLLPDVSPRALIEFLRQVRAVLARLGGGT